MTNKEYKIFGKIISIISNDYPPKISKNFSNKVMNRIYSCNKKYSNRISSSYLNIAASIFFAIITTFALVNYDEYNNTFSPVISNETEKEESNLIRRVIDKEPCEAIDNKNGNENKNEYEKCN